MIKILMLVAAVLLLCALRAHSEPLPVPQQQQPGGSCPNGYISSGSFCVPSGSRQDAVAKPPSGTCPNGWLSSGSYCLRSGSRN
jgi:hypothetical protein